MNYIFTDEAEAQNSDSVCSPVVEEKSEVSASKSSGQGKSKHKMNIPKILKKTIAKNLKKADTPDTPGTTNFFPLMIFGNLEVS